MPLPAVSILLPALMVATPLACTFAVLNPLSGPTLSAKAGWALIALLPLLAITTFIFSMSPLF